MTRAQWDRANGGLLLGLGFDDRYHGDLGCKYDSEFRCTSCRRRICWCGGHAGLGTRACPVNCAKCDECCFTELVSALDAKVETSSEGNP